MQMNIFTVLVCVCGGGEGECGIIKAVCGAMTGRNTFKTIIRTYDSKWLLGQVRARALGL